jgi:hypothetical protein
VFYRTPKVRGRIVKVANAFDTFIVEIPPINDRDLFVTQMNQVDQEIEDIGSTMEHTRTVQMRALASSVAPYVRKWLAVAQRRKAIFHTVTKFRPTTESPGGGGGGGGGGGAAMGLGFAGDSNTNAVSQSMLLVSEGWMLAEGADDILMKLRTASVDGSQIIVMVCSKRPRFSFLFFPLFPALPVITLPRAAPTFFG